MVKNRQQTSAKKSLLRAVGFRIIPLTVTMLSLALVIKINDLYIGSRALDHALSIRSAQASGAPKEEKPEAAAPEGEAAHADASEKKTDAHGGEEKKEEKVEEGEHGEKKEPKDPDEPKTHGLGRKTIKEIEALKAKQNTAQFTQTELDLLQNLVKRREEIEKREKEFEVKSAVLGAAEKRIDDKVVEMKALQIELAKVVAKYNDHQNAEIRGLVKIYETMKPGDAANIFNELEMPILLEVIDKMSERKVAPILAGMNPKRARDVTQQLAELRRGRVVINKKTAEQAAAPPQ
jgi:flagellar motility protein MotE (MotC chaperone)